MTRVASQSCSSSFCHVLCLAVTATGLTGGYTAEQPTAPILLPAGRVITLSQVAAAVQIHTRKPCTVDRRLDRFTFVVTKAEYRSLAELNLFLGDLCALEVRQVADELYIGPKHYTEEESLLIASRAMEMVVSRLQWTPDRYLSYTDWGGATPPSLLERIPWPRLPEHVQQVLKQASSGDMRPGVDVEFRPAVKLTIDPAGRYRMEPATLRDPKTGVTRQTETRSSLQFGLVTW